MAGVLDKAIKSDLYNVLREELAKPDIKTGKSYIQMYVPKMLEEAIKNPNSQVGRWVSEQLMQQDIIEKLDAETDKYLARDVDFAEYRLCKALYKEQQELYNDRVDKKIICIGSRRIGKTELAGRLLARDVLRENRHAVYINLKFDNAIKQCYPIVIKELERIGQNIVKGDRSAGYILLNNGSDIKFVGNHDKASADKLLGFKYSLAIIDEVQNQTNLQYMLDTVLGPTTADYIDSQIICLGTPPRVPHTYAERLYATENNGWKKYGWNMLNNPFLSNINKLIESICIEKGVDINAPFIQREYFGKVGIYDIEARVIKNPLLYSAPNIDTLDYLIPMIKSNNIRINEIYGGIDFGFEDYNAIVTIGWDKEKDKGYIIDSYKFNKASVTEIVEKVKESMERSKRLLFESSIRDPDNHIRYYADNSDKSIVHELNVNYNIPVSLAYKHNKMEALSMLSELLRKKIYTPVNSSLTDEYEMTVYKRDEATDAVLPELDDDAFHADALMALLYASRSLVLDENPIGKETAYTDEIKVVEKDDAYLRPEDFNNEGIVDSVYA